MCVCVCVGGGGGGGGGSGMQRYMYMNSHLIFHEQSMNHISLCKEASVV